MKDRLLEEFQKIFGAGGEIRTYFAPGRVNLIGEHTDYNGGHVFPCALTIGSYVAARRREDRKIRFYSENFGHMGIMESDLDALSFEAKADWTNYPKGVVWAFREKGMEADRGFDYYIYGNIPNGSGLSSSASVEVATGVMLRDMFGFQVNMSDIARIGQYSENHFNGVNCGIMDQFAVAMGKADHGIFLDTSSLKYEYAPVRLDNGKIVISCSNKRRGLGESKYNERRRECEEAVAALQRVVPIRYLGELTKERFEELKGYISDPVCLRRARHAVYENQRTIEAAEALKANDIERFGRLMNASHISLRDDYEVTGRELDTLAEAAWEQEGVIGSRMTGAGFGGCTVSIVKEEWTDAFIRNVGKKYIDTIGYQADFYVVEIGDGAGVL